jgi:nucleoside-diphosphate-sugar epimerase
MILITGHKGFIGSHLTRSLDKSGYKWIGYDLVEGSDIRDKLRLEQFFDSYPIDTVIHLAALAGARRGETYPQEYFDTNVIGTENVARMCEKYGVKKLIAFSSASANTCQNTYGITKHAMELMLMKVKIPMLYVVRPFNVYGENGRPDQVIWKWLEKAKAGQPIEFHGDLKRNYTYVGDVVSALYVLLKQETALGYRITDFGCEKKVGLSELLKVFQEKFPNLKVIEKPMSDIETSPSPELEFNTDFISKVKELIK